MKSTIKTAAILIAVYHTAALLTDAEQCFANLRRLQASPTPENFLLFIAADGVLAKDILTA